MKYQALFILCVTHFVVYGQSGAKAVSGKSIDGKFVTANGISIHYNEWGKGDTLLLLHGNSQSLQAFDKQVPEFSKYFHVVAMDSRGQGSSTRDDRKFTYDLMADDVVAFLDALSIQRVNIVGWSDGGNIGLIVAMKHPHRVKKLATMGANLYSDTTAVDPEIIHLVQKSLAALKAINKPSDNFRIEMMEMLLSEPHINPDDLTRIQCPALIMAGSKDIILESHTQLIAGKIKNARCVIFDPGTHFEPIQNPKRFNKAVIDFFKQGASLK